MGMNFDVMTGALSVVVKGRPSSVLVTPDGIIVEPPLWMTMQQAMSMAARIRAMERLGNHGRGCYPATSARGPD